MSSSSSATFSVGRTRDLAWMPVLRAFMEEAALPVTEVGPVDFWALRRFASLWRRGEIRGRGDELRSDGQGKRLRLLSTKDQRRRDCGAFFLIFVRKEG